MLRVEKPVARHQPEEWHRSNKAMREASEDVRTTSHDLRHQALHLRHQASLGQGFQWYRMLLLIKFSQVYMMTEESILNSQERWHPCISQSPLTWPYVALNLLLHKHAWCSADTNEKLMCCMQLKYLKTKTKQYYKFIQCKLRVWQLYSQVSQAMTITASSWQTSNKTTWDQCDSTTRLQDRIYEVHRVTNDLQRSLQQVRSGQGMQFYKS